MDHEKLHATLTEEHLNAACDLKKACETVALLEAQLKEMNPNLDSIAEYGFSQFIILTGFLFGVALKHFLIYDIRYRKKVALYNERVEELNAVTQERDDIKKQYDELRKKRCTCYFLLYH